MAAWAAVGVLLIEGRARSTKAYLVSKGVAATKVA